MVAVSEELAICNIQNYNTSSRLKLDPMSLMSDTPDREFSLFDEPQTDKHSSGNKSDGDWETVSESNTEPESTLGFSTPDCELSPILAIIPETNF